MKFKEVKLGQDIRHCNAETPTVMGKFLGIEELTDMDGQPKVSKLNPSDTIKVLNFQELETDEKFAVWHNRGLEGKLKYKGVKVGDMLKITFTGKGEYDGKPVNEYDIVGLVAE